jgi:hypothetical protein
VLTKGVLGQKEQIAKEEGEGEGGDEEDTSRFLFFFRQSTIKNTQKKLT